MQKLLICNKFLLTSCKRYDRIVDGMVSKISASRFYFSFLRLPYAQTATFFAKSIVFFFVSCYNTCNIID